jgi:prephenate dehydratase
LYGSVFENYDYLLKYKVYVIGELNLHINHFLIASKKYSLTKIKNVYSHPQALGQCSQFIKSLNKVEIIPSYDTAGSALLASNETSETSAAITSARAAKIYKMQILKRNIQNNKINFTRFFVIIKEEII